jgi:hypothetical protein
MYNLVKSEPTLLPAVKSIAQHRFLLPEIEVTDYDHRR